ncbi:hypothetical protein [Sphingomonas morindae]|uniref:Uncharacterized protein n=1 Tax=Sphingomonas morindae TaxID=1541170 RepID=A0ABY4XAS6_9SPHN|nr:hypothetical protein [Sphingomonas morindae]USI73781.1 hypothetical protein LHA26_04750 [Sphingomonas morindae]
MSGTGPTSAPPPADPAAEPFIPEGAEWEAAGGLVHRPPTPAPPPVPPSQGDER